MKSLLFFVHGLSLCLSLLGQCPNRDFLWHRIMFLRDSSNITDDEQLDELLSYQKRIDQSNCEIDSAKTLLLQRIGGLYTKKNNFFKAIQYTQKSISLINKYKNKTSINPALLIKCYHNLQIVYDSLKLETLQIAALDSCVSYAISLGTGYDYALNALRHIVVHSFYIGDYFSCIEYADLGESIAPKTNYTATEIEEKIYQDFFTWKINALISLNKTAEAEKILLYKIRSAEINNRSNFMAGLYALYATVLRKEERPIEAINYYKKSFYLHKQTGYSRGSAQALTNIGFTYSNSLYQNKIALPYHFKALKFADKDETLNILDNIANIYVQAGNYDSAFIFFQKAFNQLCNGFTEADLLKTDIAELSDNMIGYITGMVIDKAAAYLSKYRTNGNKQALEEAIRIYGITDRYFDKLKSSQAEVQSRLFWKTNNRRLYEQAIEACYLSRNTEKAFYFFEKSRSVLLNDQITEQQRMNEVDLEKLAQLKQTSQDIERRLQNMEPSSKEYPALRQQLFTIKQEQEKLIRHINGQHLSYHNNLNTALTLALVREKILNNKRSLVEIFNGDSTVYVLSITPDNSAFNKLNKHLYDSLTNAYISFIAHPEILNKDFTGFIKISHQLYKLIFSNIQLQAEEGLIISPDGKGFPFEALIVNVNNNQPDYLLNHYAISYTYSAKYLMNDYPNDMKKRKSLLGVAPVKYESSFGFAALPGSDISLQNIKSNFSDATNLVYQRATRRNFLQHFYDYQIIQLYTHAADSSSNNDPVIYFADSALYLSDLIPERKPVTQLVVLSACETANGKLYQGEGIFSFNRGFAALGIPAAISNLWSVDNESTYRITELFYKYLAQGVPTDVALQKAKIEFIKSSSKEKALPYFWAGPVLMGKVDVIKSNSKFPYTTFIWTSIILLAIIWLAYMFRFHKKRKRHNL